jgi:hypothetical protein
MCGALAPFRPRGPLLGMESPRLAPVYLDDEPVALPDDPRPRVAVVLAAGGRRPEGVAVVLQQGRGTGVRVGPDEVLVRTQEPTRPIYLTTMERGGVAQVAEAPGVSGQGNAAGSLQSAYSRTGTDTAEPGMIGQEAQADGFGSGAGKGASSGARESGKATPSRMAAGLEDPFGREGLNGKVDGAGGSVLGASRPVRQVPKRATGPSGTGSEAERAEANEPEPEPEPEPR